MVHLRIKPITFSNTFALYIISHKQLKNGIRCIRYIIFGKELFHKSTKLLSSELIMSCSINMFFSGIRWTFNIESNLLTPPICYMLLILLHPVTKIYLSFNHFNNFWLSMFIMEEQSDQQQVILYTLSSFFPSPTCLWWLSASFSNMQTLLITWMQHFLPLHTDKLLNIQ